MPPLDRETAITIAIVDRNARMTTTHIMQTAFEEVGKTEYAKGGNPIAPIVAAYMQVYYATFVNLTAHKELPTKPTNL